MPTSAIPPTLPIVSGCHAEGGRFNCKLMKRRAHGGRRVPGRSPGREPTAAPRPWGYSAACAQGRSTAAKPIRVATPMP